MKILFVSLLAVLVFGCDQTSEVTQKEVSNKVATAAKLEVEAIETSKVVKEPTGSIFEYGIYNAQRKGRLRDNPDTNTGKINTLSVLEHGETTNRIPLVKDTYFAYRYRIYNFLENDGKKPRVELRKVLIHPTMTLPDGSTTNGWDRIENEGVSVGQVIEFDGYVFNEDYELVEGEWTFQIWYRDKKMVEQKFTTYRPEQTDTESKAVVPAAENKI